MPLTPFLFSCRKQHVPSAELAGAASHSPAVNKIADRQPKGRATSITGEDYLFQAIRARLLNIHISRHRRLTLFLISSFRFLSESAVQLTFLPIPKLIPSILISNMAEVLPVEQKQAEQKPDEMDTYLAEKEEFVDASEEASCTPSAHSDSQTDVSKGKENTAPKAQQNDDGPIYTLPAYPLPQCTPKPRPELTADQRKKYDALLLHVKSWTHVPKTSHKNAETEPLTDEDRLWLTHECLLRYLRATSWHSADAAAKRLLATLTWRREYGLAKFTPEYISIENETGKQTIFGFDNDGRPCLYMSPSKQNTAKSDRQLHHLVFMLERLIDIMPAGQETNALLINFKDSSSGKNPSVSQGRQTLNILQGHYPERLGRALISERK